MDTVQMVMLGLQVIGPVILLIMFASLCARVKRLERQIEANQAELDRTLVRAVTHIEAHIDKLVEE